MVDLDLSFYTALYLKSASDEINLIRDLVSKINPDIKTVHRACHSLKGKSFFMGFNEIGEKALQLEKYYRNILEDKNSDENNKIDVEAILKEIEGLLSVKSKIENQKNEDHNN